MIVASNIGPLLADRQDSWSPRLLMSFDVEWTKNFRVRNGNIPFCYSMVFLEIPRRPSRLTQKMHFWTKSVYVENADETQALIADADKEMARAIGRIEFLVGHQLPSDLSALRNAALAPTPHLDAAHQAWSGRKGESLPRVLDTRYDVPFACKSRRLVDVCESARLNVHQPELTGSMTKMHRNYLVTGDEQVRERLAVLNVRHSLSTGIVALRHLGHYRWDTTINVNRMIFANLRSSFRYVNGPAFAKLLSNL